MSNIELTRAQGIILRQMLSTEVSVPVNPELYSSADRMVKDGWLIRETSPGDGQGPRYRLSQAGQPAANQAWLELAENAIDTPMHLRAIYAQEAMGRNLNPPGISR